MRVLLNYNLSFLASALSACNIFALYTTLSHDLIKKNLQNLKLNKPLVEWACIGRCVLFVSVRLEAGVGVGVQLMVVSMDL